jgi:hypothetical protein
MGTHFFSHFGHGSVFSVLMAPSFFLGGRDGSTLLPYYELS